VTRPYAAKRLLEHGPLTFAEFMEITGWPQYGLEDALRSLARRGIVRRFYVPGCHRFVYRLAA
jgi:DNA-binding transcriptional regulator GbsR (MarR family)